MRKIILSTVMTYLVITVFAQEHQTLTYYQNDSIQLEMDLFLPETSNISKHPLVLFVHGGGFSGGNRTGGLSYCRYLAQNGYAAATISYTLYMRGKNFSCGGVTSEKVKAMQYAANDLWSATAYLIDHADQLAIDTQKIFVTGSSAGAETVLHAQYWNRSVMGWSGDPLPKGFKYKGLISGAGAIMDLNMIQKDNLIPMMLFHGSNDRTVPYGTAAHHYCPTDATGWLMFFGSHSIYEHINSLGATSQLYTYCGGGHELSAELFKRDFDLSLDFLNQVLSNQKSQKHIIIKTDKPNTGATTLCD
ncbi:alpha/beta hydrolase [Reichenbachiella sp. MSK19-1]|uniref:alpha/beta hydrolase n=1 Tax=Reichenbachiella sp. MSK19-1 TaxID=1897631 RepID=UPI000E6BA1BD|nr:alpha/beta hydrolase [Reichenbachiella sp. MSK19-1]RJE74619.1 esterase [Reichenbachiella sp. MSK19-1]